MARSGSVSDFSDLLKILPESIQREVAKMEVQPAAPKRKEHDGKGKKIHMNIERKGRKGKTVTIIGGFQHNPQTMEEISKILKAHCGAGGTVVGMTIELQGDQRKKAGEKLKKLNYSVSG
ncbi:MAG TPA: stress response translation initiation inhibitor YciH [Bacteroidota bacterium]|nr:stress response translation initiation inhibitor YciH [Bacteroidota bacterium]